MLKSLYVIAFLKFDFGKMMVEPELRNLRSLHYASTEVNLGTSFKHPGSPEFFYFDITKYDKNLEEIVDDEEFWLSLLTATPSLDEIPTKLKGRESYEAYFEATKYANFTKEDALNYERDMISELDIKLSNKWHHDQGVAEGKAEGLAEVAKAMKSEGLSLTVISKCTGFSEDEIASF